MSETKPCSICGSDMERGKTTSADGWSRQLFCSRQCKNVGKRNAVLELFRKRVRDDPDLEWERECNKCGQIIHRSETCSEMTWAETRAHKRCPRIDGVDEIAELLAYVQSPPGRAFIANCRKPKPQAA